MVAIAVEKMRIRTVALRFVVGIVKLVRTVVRRFVVGIVELVGTVVFVLILVVVAAAIVEPVCTAATAAE